MFMSRVNTNSQAIREAIDICVKAIEMLRSTNKKLRGNYVAAERDWNDAKYQQLGEIVNKCGSSFDKAIRGLDGCLVPLSSMAKFVQEYEGVNLLGSASPSTGGGSSSSTRRQTPMNNGEWSGERGNSTWQPSDEAVLNDIRFYSDGRVGGIEYRSGFADFTPVQVYECRLNSRLYYRDNNYQFVDCTLELREHLREHPDLISYFDDEQLSAIGRGQDRIPGYTWHHDIEAGRMQLIPTSIHSTCPHDGGQSIWGGGTSNR
jgi:hypothetical protein